MSEQNINRICNHCGIKLEKTSPYVYCAQGLTEFHARQCEIDTDPWQYDMVYGDFTDPQTQKNIISIQFKRDISRAEQRKMILAIKRFLKPMFDSKKPNQQYFMLDPEPIPFVGTKRLKDREQLTKLKWDRGRLTRKR